MTGIMWDLIGVGHNGAMSAVISPPAPVGSMSHRPAVSIRAVALPVEHGGWSLLAEPLLLGLIVAPSITGTWIALGAIAAFLARHPFRLVALDRRKGARYPRTALGERFFAGYAVVAAVALAIAGSRDGAFFVWPLVVAAPLAMFALHRDLAGRSREAWPEVAGAVALGASAPAILLAGGVDTTIAWIAWALVAARGATAIVYVRARIRADRGATDAVRREVARPAVAAHLGALGLAGLAVTIGHLSAIVIAPFVLLLARVVHGLARGRPPIRPQILGMQEVALGVICLILFARALAGAVV